MSAQRSPKDEQAMAAGHALAVWLRLTMSQRSKLLQLHYIGMHAADRTLQVLVRGGLAKVKIDDPRAMHAYQYSRTGWGAFVSQIGTEQLPNDSAAAGAEAQKARAK